LFGAVPENYTSPMPLFLIRVVVGVKLGMYRSRRPYYPYYPDPQQFPSYPGTFGNTRMGAAPLTLRYPPNQTLQGKPSTMRADDVYQRLVAFLRSLDEQGAAFHDTVTALLFLAVNEAAELGYSSRTIQDFVAGFLQQRHRG
jgi:hypothetical protein